MPPARAYEIRHHLVLTCVFSSHRSATCSLWPGHMGLLPVLRTWSLQPQRLWTCYSVFGMLLPHLCFTSNQLRFRVLDLSFPCKSFLTEVSTPFSSHWILGKSTLLQSPWPSFGSWNALITLNRLLPLPGMLFLVLFSWLASLRPQLSCLRDAFHGHLSWSGRPNCLSRTTLFQFSADIFLDWLLCLISPTPPQI